MEIILIILTSCILSGSYTAAFFIGKYFGKKSKPEGNIRLTENNANLIKDIGEWLMYDGRK